VRHLGAQVLALGPPLVHGSGVITLVRGDTYSLAEGRALHFVNDQWPDLATAAVRLRSRIRYDVLIDQPATTTAQEAIVELDFDQTRRCPPGAYGYDLEATLANGHVLTLHRGTLKVVRDER
jgi:hypothetical protein